MKYAADFRGIARDSLRGRWFFAVIAGLIATLLGVSGTEGPKLNFNLKNGDLRANLQIAGKDIISTDGSSELWGLFDGIVTHVVILAIVIVVILFILGSIVEVGYSRFNLDLVDRHGKPEFGTLFGYFVYWKTTACARLLLGLYVLLWSLLFIIPGIIAGYSYAMTRYILAEHPNLTASEAIAQSKAMMYGNRWRLFCLQFSFIGWSILCSLTLGIGNLWLTPYKQAATAAFYREISGTIYIPPESDTAWDS